MFHIDIQTIFLGYIIINIVSAFLIGSIYSQVKFRYTESFSILLSFIVSASGNTLLFFQNIFTDWISIVVGNTLVVASTVLLMIGFEQFVNKRGIHVQNYLLVIIFLLVQSYFTFIEPDTTIRRLNISISYVLLSFQIAWLMLVRVPLKMRKLTRSIGLIFCVLFIIHISRIILIIYKQEQIAHYFKLGNSEAFFLSSYGVIFIILTYSISLMYNKSLIIDIIKKEKKISLLSVEKYKNELDYKNKELTMKVLYLSSLKEVNKSILAELKSNRHNLTQPEDYCRLPLFSTFY